MKKIIYSLLSIALVLSTTSFVPCYKNNATIKTEVASPQMSTTEIFNYLNTNLGLSAAQKPVVQKAVDEAGAETAKLNADASKTAAQVSAGKTSIVNNLVKKLSGGVLNAIQTKKLSGLTSQLTAMFAQLK